MWKWILREKNIRFFRRFFFLQRKNLWTTYRTNHFYFAHAKFYDYFRFVCTSYILDQFICKFPFFSFFLRTLWYSRNGEHTIRLDAPIFATSLTRQTECLTFSIAHSKHLLRVYRLIVWCGSNTLFSWITLLRLYALTAFLTIANHYFVTFCVCVKSVRNNFACNYYYYILLFVLLSIVLLTAAAAAAAAATTKVVNWKKSNSVAVAI